MSDRTLTVEVAVLGAGPAGVATACALRRLGHTVRLFGRPRPRALEGLSVRARALLESHGLTTAVACAAEPAQRGGRWAGEAVNAGHEFLVDRTPFDRALGQDAASHGVRLEEDVALAFDLHAHGGWRVHSRSGIYRAGVVIDARGRRSGRALERGPSLIALTQRLTRVPPNPPRTHICPLEDGWCWFASDGAAGTALQLITTSRRLARRADPEQRLRECLVALAACESALRRALPAGPFSARAASARLRGPSTLAPGCVPAGDAAVVMDPLSGHGLYEALAWAAAASAAAHTYLEGHSWEPIERFLSERAHERWRTGVASASGFYRQQAAATPTAFWQHCAEAYTKLSRTNAPARVPGAHWQERPVLNGSMIEMRPVVVTQDRPRGVWQVEGVELARLAEFFVVQPAAEVTQAARQLAHSPVAVSQAVRWLRAHGLLQDGRRASATRA